MGQSHYGSWVETLKMRTVRHLQAFGQRRAARIQGRMGKKKEGRKRERFPRSLSLPSPPRCLPKFLCAVPTIWMPPLTGLRSVRFAYVISYSLASHTLRSGTSRVWYSTSVRSCRRFTNSKPILRKKQNNNDNDNDGDSFAVYLSFNRILLSITLTALWRQANGFSLEQIAERSENGYYPNVWNRITEHHPYWLRFLTLEWQPPEQGGFK